MRILAFDTATRATAVALVDTGAAFTLEARDDPPAGARPGHARRLLPLIDELLRESGEGWAGIDRIAVGVGPGTFTGLRIGIATAHALARAREIELVGVSTLASLALRGRDAGPLAGILALLDARRGEAFGAAWGPGTDPLGADPVLEPRVLRPQELGGAAAAAAAGAGTPVAVGDGAIQFRAVLTDAGVEVPPDDSPMHVVSAIPHCRLAAGLAAAAVEEVVPAYLRAPDAKPSVKRPA